jgi:putative ABC transport system permease protein
MDLLHRKLLRDGRARWSQVVTISMVVACGIGGLITSLSAVDTLARARADYYDQALFADVFAEVERAPRALLDTLRALPGVAAVQATTEKLVRIEIPERPDPILGRLIGLDLRRTPLVNQVALLQGHPLTPARSTLPSHHEIDTLVSAGFAKAWGLTPGSRIQALINGTPRTLLIQGWAVSPEYIFAGLTGMPDLRGFGVFWIDDAVMADAWSMRGALNRLALRLAPGADEAAILAHLDRLLARFGGRNAYGRADQVSHTMLEQEIREQRVIGTLLPALFIAVACVLLNIAVARLIATQRESIATLTALGFSNGAIARHYLQGVGVIVALGLSGGLLLGMLLGGRLTALYGTFLQFPRLDYRLPGWLLVASVLLACATAFLGALSAINQIMRLTPAQALQPAVPRHNHSVWIERWLPRAISPSQSMMLRHMARHPWRTSLTIGGVAAAMALVILGSFVRDAIKHIETTVFDIALHADVMVWLNTPSGDHTGRALARLPGVMAVEPGRDVFVRLSNAHRSKRMMLQGWPSPSGLRQIVDVDQHVLTPSGQGLIMTDRLARQLGLRIGDPVRVDVLEGRRPSRVLLLDQTVRDIMGLNAYLPRHTLNAMMGEGPQASRFALALTRGSEPAFLDASKAIPGLSGVLSKATLVRNMREISSRNVRIMSAVMTAFAIVMAIGVIDNDARIALAERAWEFASLRVLGLTQGEVSGVLLGELILRLIAALPLGMFSGTALVHGVAAQLRTDQFFFPVVIEPRTHALAALTVLAASALSAQIMRRRINQLDLIAVLKVRA